MMQKNEDEGRINTWEVRIGKHTKVRVSYIKLTVVKIGTWKGFNNIKRAFVSITTSQVWHRARKEYSGACGESRDGVGVGGGVHVKRQIRIKHTFT